MSQPSTTNIWEDLVISILSVNQYTLSNTYKSLKTLEAVGLFDPKNLIVWSIDEIEAKLKEGGCDRGDFMTHLFAERLVALSHLLQEKGVSSCEAILTGASVEDIDKLLMPVRGIRPKVLQNFLSLTRDKGTA